MKRKKKAISFIFIILSLCIVLGEVNYIAFSKSHTKIACDSCTDISLNLVQNHSHDHEEIVGLYERYSKEISTQNLITYISFTERNSSILIISKIWQPPRL